MATAAHRTFEERRFGERRHSASAVQARSAGEGMRVSWGGIWGGVLVAIGLMLLLAALGVAVGISASDPGETQASTLGTGAGLWAGISLLVALFVGGMVATRIGAIYDRATGMFEGVLVWVVSVLLIGYLAGSGIGMVAGGVFKLVGGAGQTLSAAVGGSGADLSSGSVEQIMQRLEDPQTAATLAAATGMPQAEVQSTLSDIAQRVEEARDNPAQAAAQAREGLAQLYEDARASGAIERKAEEIKPQASAAAWMTFAALVVSLLAAVFGAMVGRRRQPMVMGT